MLACVRVCLYRPISASQLKKPLQAFHPWSINPVIHWGPPTPLAGGVDTSS